MEHWSGVSTEVADGRVVTPGEAHTRSDQHDRSERIGESGGFALVDHVQSLAEEDSQWRTGLERVHAHISAVYARYPSRRLRQSMLIVRHMLDGSAGS